MLHLSFVFVVDFAYNACLAMASGGLSWLGLTRAERRGSFGNLHQSGAVTGDGATFLLLSQLLLTLISACFLLKHAQTRPPAGAWTFASPKSSNSPLPRVGHYHWSVSVTIRYKRIYVGSGSRTLNALQVAFAHL